MDCDYCETSTPIKGYHYIEDPEGIEGTVKIPCTNEEYIEDSFARDFDAKIFAEQDELAYLDRELFGRH